MLNNLKQMLAVSINDMIMQAMEPAALLRELTEQLEQYAVSLRTETARSIAAENRLRESVEAGGSELQPELDNAAFLAAEQRDLLDQLEKRIADAKMQAQRLAASSASDDSRVVSQGISGQFRKLDDYLNSLKNTKKKLGILAAANYIHQDLDRKTGAISYRFPTVTYPRSYYDANMATIMTYPASIMEEMEIRLVKILTALGLLFFACLVAGFLFRIPFPVLTVIIAVAGPIMGVAIWRHRAKISE